MPQYGKAALSLGLVLAALAILYFFAPGAKSIYPPCPFHLITGLHCPGCGTLRAMNALLHGHVLTAFGFNPLALLMLPVVGYFFLSYLLTAFGRKPLPHILVSPNWWWSFLGMVIIFWITRNLSFYPFTLLAP